jgi:hypothetical protein
MDYLAISIYQKQADGKSIVLIFMLFGIDYITIRRIMIYQYLKLRQKYLI